MCSRCYDYALKYAMIQSEQLLAPMLVFTADETWEHIAHKPADEAALMSVHLAKLPEASALDVSEMQREQWNLLMALRDSGTLQLDAMKKSAGLNKAGEAEAIFEIKDDESLRKVLKSYGSDLEDLVSAGFHSFAPASTDAAVAVKIVDRRNDYKACARCWKPPPGRGTGRGVSGFVPA